MPEIIEFLAGEQLQVGLLSRTDKKQLVVTDERDRPTKISPDKVLFRHRADSVAALLQRVEAVQAEVDVPLLWEALLAEEQTGAREAPALARLFFDEDDALHGSAVFRALVSDRVHFRRRGTAFEARSAAEIEQLRAQREAEARNAAELAELRAAIRRGKVDAPLAARLLALLRRRGDKLLEEALAEIARDPARRAFSLLVDGGHLPADADLEVVRAGLTAGHPAAVVEHAEQRLLPPAPPLLDCAFSIDDPDTREVDDALSISREGELHRVDIDIADAAAFVRAGDPVDREAQRRATTVYLPTTTYYMLPAVISADRASLHPAEPRPAVRTSVWLDAQGLIQRTALSRNWVRVARRLDYDEADRLIAEGAADDATAEALRALQRLGAALREQRIAAGAFTMRRHEWKVRVAADGEIVVKRLPPASPSRELVAEMMILANRVAAEAAVAARIPAIFRVQPPPPEPLPQDLGDDPFAFFRLRGAIGPAKISVHPGRHFALGLESYTQATSPLRRYADLVLQRQLSAHLAGEAPPHSAEELLAVLADVEATDGEMKKVEAAVNQRWALEHVARGPRAGVAAWVVGEAHAGYRALLCDSGAQGTLNKPPRAYDIGEEVLVNVEEVKPRRGTLRLRAAG